MKKKEKKATGRFLIVFIMALFTSAVFIWAIGGLIGNLNKKSPMQGESNDDIISDKTISEVNKIDSEKLAENILSKVKFDTELKRIDSSVAEGMIKTDKESELNIYMGSGNFSDELIIVRSADEEKAEKDQKVVEDYLKDMRKSFEAYIPEQAKKISDARITYFTGASIICLLSKGSSPVTLFVLSLYFSKLKPNPL